MIVWRPGKRAIASHAPMGAPISSATMLAVRLTRSDKATIPRSSGSAWADQRKSSPDGSREVVHPPLRLSA
jgi:hypothetical protein